jgi:hypothetical protein
MKTRSSLLILGCVIIVFISVAFYFTHKGPEVATIDSAKELEINASEIGTGWVGVFEYTSDPVKSFEEICEYLETYEYLESTKEQMKKNKRFDEDIFEENLKTEKDRFQELSDKLRECGVKDGYVLQLNKKTDGFTKGYAEADVYVFNDIEGAEEFFGYMENKTNGTSISGIGDEAAISQTGTSYLVRVSNAVAQVVVFGEEEVWRVIAEKIVEKVKRQ